MSYCLDNNLEGCEWIKAFCLLLIETLINYKQLTQAIDAFFESISPISNVYDLYFQGTKLDSASFRPIPKNTMVNIKSFYTRLESLRDQEFHGEGELYNLWRNTNIKIPIVPKIVTVTSKHRANVNSFMELVFRHYFLNDLFMERSVLGKLIEQIAATDTLLTDMYNYFYPISQELLFLDDENPGLTINEIITDSPRISTSTRIEDLVIYKRNEIRSEMRMRPRSVVLNDEDLNRRSNRTTKQMPRPPHEPTPKPYLKKKVLRGWDVIQEREDEVCDVCQIKIRGLHLICLKCSHGGHIDHIVEWFKINQYCPKCRKCTCIYS